jgi:hypothetical protein
MTRCVSIRVGGRIRKAKNNRSRDERSNGLGILLARPPSTQAWGHQAYQARSLTGAEASEVER